MPATKTETTNLTKNPMPTPTNVSSSKLNRILLVLAVIAFLGLATVIYLILTNEPSKNPNTSIPSDYPNIVDPNYQPTNPAFGDGSGQKPFILLDETDSLRQSFKPVDLVIGSTSEEGFIPLSWKNPPYKQIPTKWLIAYFDQPFDPVKAMNDELPGLEIDWNQLKSPDDSRSNPLKTSLYVNHYQEKGIKKIYIYLIARVKLSDDKFADYIYGKNLDSGMPIETEI